MSLFVRHQHAARGTTQAAGFHTMCLLDIKVKEQSKENMAKGIKEYLPPRYMSINTCIEQVCLTTDRVVR